MRAWVASIAFFLAAIVGTPAYAQTAPDSARVAQARILVELAGTGDQIVVAIDAAIPLMRQAISAPSSGLTPRQVEQYIAAFRTEIRAELPQVLDEVALEYARIFSDDDIAALIAFYSSESGRRFVQRAPDLQRAAQAVGERAGQRAGARALESIRK